MDRKPMGFRQVEGDEAVKILLTVCQFDQPHGTETGIMALCKAATKLGHQCMVYAPKMGWCSRYVESNGWAICSDDLGKLGRWDVIWGNHAPTLDAMKRSKAPSCLILHDMINGEPAQNNPVIPGVNAYFAVTEEMESWLFDNGHPCAGIIRQPIDVSVFMPTRKHLPGDKPRVLYLDSDHVRCKEITGKVRMACDALGSKFLSATGDTPHDRIPEVINRADLVVASTRAAIEAALCGKNVIVCSAWGDQCGTGLDGLVTLDNVHEMERTNWTGSVLAEEATVQSIEREIRRFSFILGEALLPIVRRSHDSMRVADRLVAWSESML